MFASRYLLLVTSLLLLLLSAAEAWNAYSFSSRMNRANGVVVDLHRDTLEDDFHFHPVISYHDRNGKEYRHVPGVGGAADDYAIGQQVSIWFEPGEPLEARLVSFYELWGVALLTGLLGIAGITGFLIRRPVAAAAEGIHLHTDGRPVQARIEGVLHNTEMEVNGFSPFRLKARWCDPGEGVELTFYSQDLWFDPSEALGGRKEVTVYFDPKEPERYFMDVSFLLLDKQ